MFQTIQKFRYLSLFVVTVLLSSCSSSSEKSNQQDVVVIHSLSEPENLNPFTSSDAQASQIKLNIFQSLLQYDFKTLSLVPVLADSLPEVGSEGNGISLTFNIRPEARWDNGEPITAKDVVFSLKALLCPKVNSDAVKTYFEFVDDIKLYEDNPLKFTVLTKRQYMLAQDIIGFDLKIMPEYLFDAKQILREFPVKAFTNQNEAFLNNPKFKEFADAFNSEEFGRSPEKINGSGAYKLANWQTQQRVILERKENWWGDKLKGENMFFDIHPKKLVYEVINDFNTALTALKAGKLDVMYVTPVKDYMDLDQSTKFKDNFIKSEPDMLAFQYIGLNVRDKILSDKKVRQALAYLTDVEQINEKILYGKGERIVGPILPQFKDAYASEIPLYDYNVEKAKQLLAEAGWKDTDGDGILDKVIDGQKTPLKLTYTYNQGNSMRETIGLMFQNWLKQAGITMEIRSLEWGKYLGDLKQQKIQIFYGSWVTDPRSDDPRQLWHTESRNGGSNYTGFGDSKTDQLIVKIGEELDETKRNVLYHQWQEILHEEVPYIFLNNQKFRNVINNRFDNINPSSIYPGYFEGGFTVNEKN
ncbi:MAG TPA: ABC transporter substrate-binding protein [Chitinophagales bacterium]|nr:ABC transporter substrate-binding protein [Chitinophagales bacterium]